MYIHVSVFPFFMMFSQDVCFRYRTFSAMNHNDHVWYREQTVIKITCLKSVGNCTSVAFHGEAVESSFLIRSMIQIQASGSQSVICAFGKLEQRCALRRGAAHFYYRSDLRVLSLFQLQFERTVMSKHRKDHSSLFI